MLGSWVNNISGRLMDVLCILVIRFKVPNAIKITQAQICRITILYLPVVFKLKLLLVTNSKFNPIYYIIGYFHIRLNANII